MSYTGTTPKDLDLSTPDGAAEYGNILDDAIIEVKKVFKYSQAINTVTTDTTLDATYSFVLANKATAIAITLPSASTVASSTFTKEYRIKNIGVGACTITGTVTLNGSATVNPVLSQYTEIYLWTDGATWYGMRFSDDNIANCVVMTNSSGLIDPNSIGGGLVMTGETSATSATSTVEVDMGAVTSGDRILVVGHVVGVWSVAATGMQGYLTRAAGATITIDHNRTTHYWPISESVTGGTYYGGSSAVVKVTSTSSSLWLRVGHAYSGGTNTSFETQIYAFFLKKQ